MLWIPWRRERYHGWDQRKAHWVSVLFFLTHGSNPCSCWCLMRLQVCLLRVCLHLAGLVWFKRSSVALLVWLIWISVNAAVKAPEAVLTPLHILTLYGLPAIKTYSMYTHQIGTFSPEHCSFGCLVIKVKKVDQSGCDRICLCVFSCL